MDNKILEELSEIKSLIIQNTYRKYLDMRQLIEFTTLSGSTIRRAINKGALRASKKTGKLLFNLKDVDRWLNA